MKNDETIVKLTPREMEIIILCKKDISRKVMAPILKITIKTLDVHFRNIHLKTRTFSKAGIVEYAYENHLYT